MLLSQVGTAMQSGPVAPATSANAGRGTARGTGRGAGRGAMRGVSRGGVNTVAMRDELIAASSTAPSGEKSPPTNQVGAGNGHA